MAPYKIKQIPEDFIVEELFDLKEKPGNYFYFILKKKNYSTTNALRTISRILSVPLKSIGFSGMKDKNAVTTQLISIKNCKKEISIKNLETKFLGTSNEPVTLGSHKGNHFEITVRNIIKKPEIKKTFINYFGEQRFSKNNVEIGRSILKRDWKTVVKLIDNNFVKQHLKNNPTDYLGALKILPIKITRLFVASYQSYLWNQTVKNIKNSSFQNEKLKNQTLNVPGFGVKLHKKTLELLSRDGLVQRDFIIKEFPQLTLEGVKRPIFAKVKNLEIGNLQNDELNKNKKKLLLKFDLNKSCYATEFIKQLFQS